MENQPTDFNTYTLTDLLDNPDFVLWVFSPTIALDTYWQEVQAAHPHLSLLIAQARKLSSTLQFSTDQLDEKEKEQLWLNIQSESKLNTGYKTDQTTTPKHRKVIPLWLRTAAAAMLAGAVLTIGLYFYNNSQVNIDTTYGQLKTVTLPDGSVVTLNANSRLHYARNWDTNKSREVWIEGEAFFKVSHLHQSGSIKAGDRFIVHAQKVNIEVLGTSFNVNNRRGIANVALLTGKVGLSTGSATKPVIIMKPGEVVEYLDSKNSFKKTVRNSQDYASWTTGKFYFNNTPLTEVFRKIEDIYGYQIVVKDPALRNIGNRKISGAFTLSDKTFLFKALAVTLNISVQDDAAARQLILTSISVKD